MKKPLPWMARSVVRPVTCEAPWVKTRSMVPRLEPSPTWVGLMPARVAVEPDAPDRVWEIASAKVTCEALKPVVLTLAMLLPTTSIIVWWLRRPETPENIERIMVGTSSSLGGSVWFGLGGYSKRG